MSRESYLSMVERSVGWSIAQIRDASPRQLAEHIQAKTGKKRRVYSAFPAIGRGSVTHRLLDSATIDARLDKALCR